MENSNQAHARMWTKIVGVLMDKSAGSSQRDNAHFAVAEYVRRNKEMFRPLSLPQRPVMIGDDDEILAAKERSKRTAEMTRKLGMFTAWSSAVVRREARNAGTLGIVLNSMRTFARLGIDESTSELLEFAREEFGWCGGVLTELSDVRSMSYSATMDRALLSDDLRRGERVRRTESAPVADDLTFMEQLDL